MENNSESKKDPPQEKIWITPELKRIPMDDEEITVEVSQYDVQQLKEVIKKIKTFCTRA